jgi:hypothetical protein
MKILHSISAFTLAVTLFAAGQTARAETRLAYCSMIGAAFNASGAVAGTPEAWTTWYTSAGVNPAWACRLAAANLLANKGLDPVRMDSGYYDGDGDNSVEIDCFDQYRETVGGHGAAALQSAFDRISQLNKPCLMRVLIPQ